MAFIELIIIAWFYGVDGFFKNVEEMKIKIPGFMKIYWKTCWLFITPVLIGNSQCLGVNYCVKFGTMVSYLKDPGGAV